MWSRNPPEKTGWYFYTDNPKDWDLARPVPITSVESCGTPIQFFVDCKYLEECPVRIRTEQVLQLLKSSSKINVSNLKGLWFGPIDTSGLKIMPPKELLQD